MYKAAQSHRNPLEIVGRYHWGDYKLFKNYLRLPPSYLAVIFKNYKEDLHIAVRNLPVFIEKYHKFLWEKKLMHEEVSFLEKRWAAAGIPVTYFKSRPVICSKTTEQGQYETLARNVTKLANKGVALYLHSPQSDGAMMAGFSMVKSAIEAGIKAICISYPSVSDVQKATWDGDPSSIQKMAAIKTYPIILLYAIGSEFTSTGYFSTVLKNIIDERNLNGLTTILVSGLDPKEYITRYGREPEAITIGFTDTKIKQTLRELAKELSQ